MSNTQILLLSVGAVANSIGCVLLNVRAEELSVRLHKLNLQCDVARIEQLSDDDQRIKQKKHNLEQQQKCFEWERKSTLQKLFSATISPEPNRE